MSARRKGFAAGIITALVSLSMLTGCPKDPYDAQTWIDKLDDRGSVERAITELSRLKDPKSIEPLGKTWRKHNRPSRILRVIIDIAGQHDKGTVPKDDPDYEYKAKSKYGAFYKNGPYWDKAIPFLEDATNEFINDELKQQAIENAVLAIDALGRAKDANTVETLIKVANKKMPKKAPGQRVRLAALKALGSFGKDPRAVKTLIKVLERKPEEQRIELYAAAADALARTRNKMAVKPLIKAMFKMGAIYQFCRRALVAIGKASSNELLEIFRGKNKEMNAFAKENKFNVDCKKKAGWKSKCKAPSALQFKSATLLGDMAVKAAVPDLVKALDSKPMPSFFSARGDRGPPQHFAILDALRKIGDSSVAPDVWKFYGKAEGWMKPLVIDVYSFLATDTSKLKALEALVCKRVPGKGKKKGQKVCENAQMDQNLRMGGALAHARLVRSKADLDIHRFMMLRYKKEADKAETPAKKAKKEMEASKKALESARKALQKAQVAAGKKKDDPTLKAAQDKMDKAEAAHMKNKGKFDDLNGKALAYRGFQRTFQQHMARAWVGIKCKGKGAACYAGMLKKKPSDIAKMLGKDASDFKKWRKQFKKTLYTAATERAMLELMKLGPKAASVGDTLLDIKYAGTEDRIVRQAVWLALVHSQKRPCAKCADVLDSIISRDRDNTALRALNSDMQVLKYFFQP